LVSDATYKHAEGRGSFCLIGESDEPNLVTCVILTDRQTVYRRESGGGEVTGSLNAPVTEEIYDLRADPRLTSLHETLAEVPLPLAGGLLTSA
jgi:hypothetical protein